MAHLHEVYDNNTHFKINPTTRTFSNASEGKTTLVQGDHNSERITFEIPRIVDGHDMSLCNRIEIHYINIDSVTKDSFSDVYEVDDTMVSTDNENMVEFSWLVSGNATRYNGILSFSISMKCVTNDTIDYRWNTSVYDRLSIGKCYDNSQEVIELYSDVLEQWKAELFETIGDIPTRTSQLENDSGFLTEHQDLSDYALKDEIPTVPKKVSELTNDSGFITQENVPTKTSQLQNDSNFLTTESDPTVPSWAKQPTKPVYDYSEIQNTPTLPSVEGLAKEEDIPTKTSELENDSGFITINDVPSGGSGGVTSYNDLTDKPTIPSKTSELENDSNYVDNNSLNNTLNEMATEFSQMLDTNYYNKTAINNAISNYYTKTQIDNLLDDLDTGGGGVTSFNDLTDKPFEVLSTENVDVVSSNTFAFTSDPLFGDDGVYSYIPNLQSDTSNMFVLEKGKEYKVMWDDVLYTCTCEEYSFMGLPALAIGNGNIVGLQSEANEPFIIAYMENFPDVPNYCGFLTLDTSNEHDVYLYYANETVKQLDKKFVDGYTKAEIDAMFGTYVNEVDTLLGGE